MKNIPLEHLISENVGYAKVLNRLGVNVSQSSTKTLDQICQENGFPLDSLIRILEQSDNRRCPTYLDLRNYPVRLIVEYLKHAHQIFVKDTLPYILRKVEELDYTHNSTMIEDLKVVLPMFMEDFIHHIYEEEDELFSYACDLERFTLGKKMAANLVHKLSDFSIQQFALNHNDSDHEMKGIRGITLNYNTDNVHNPELRVLLKSLEQFDRDLTVHANIENDILFPKALMLEKKAKSLLIRTAGLN